MSVQTCVRCGNRTEGATREEALNKQLGHTCVTVNPIVHGNSTPRAVMLAKAADQCVRVKTEVYKLKGMVDAIAHEEQRTQAQEIFARAYEGFQELQSFLQSK